MGAKVDITGKRFGRLLVLEETCKRINGSIVWLCRCDCGNIKEISSKNLGRNTTSCGCYQLEVARRIGKETAKNLTGIKFGKLTALRFTGKKKGNNYIWECRCDCGNITEVPTSYLGKDTKSCGCLVAETSAALMKSLHKKQKGFNHPSYNPLMTDEERLKKRYVLGKHKQTDFRERVFERDKYTCQNCFKRGCTLNAHHLDAWNKFPEKRFDVKNGIALCVYCHRAFHSQYGYGNNTRKQFEEFNKSWRCKNDRVGRYQMAHAGNRY